MAGRATPWLLALLSAVLLTLSFPNFDLSIFAWVALVPLLLALSKPICLLKPFLLDWFAGTVFFYASCSWLTYSMIHYGGISRWLAYLLLLPATLLVGLFPGFFVLAQARLFRKWGESALMAAPFLWVSLEWARLGVTGQLWNAIGYSQAFHPNMIWIARYGGVYAVGFALVSVNAAVAYAIIRRTGRALVVAAAAIVVIAVALSGRNLFGRSEVRPMKLGSDSSLVVIAIQPNVPMDFDKDDRELNDLLNRHITLAEAALSQVKDESRQRLVIWPESPMNFTYAADPQLRERLAEFTQRNRTMLLFNSQEPSPDGSFYNSAMLIDEFGRVVARYDKIRLMPFGEYVPLPRWVPGADRVKALVGGFAAGDKFTVMTAGRTRLGTFICIESAYPWVARNLTVAGADVLVNISNDGYLGPTAVMRQHLANAIFRAVENGRPLLRVTNTGITASISSTGQLFEVTNGFEIATRIWNVYAEEDGQTFFTRHGDLFVGVCSVLSAVMFLLSFISSRHPTPQIL